MIRPKKDVPLSRESKYGYTEVDIPYLMAYGSIRQISERAGRIESESANLRNNAVCIGQN